ncbi:MAG: PIN domain-containing protein [Terriglobales bacterium]|jgi:PIN domain nuclease of toxin-antitoxin system
MVRYVLDSSAILRYLDDEAGAARVAEIIKSHLAGGCEAVVSALHWGEVAGITCKLHGRPAMDLALSRLSSFGLPIIAADADRAVRSSLIKLRLIKLKREIPYVDAFGIELACDSRDHIFVTADFDFKPASRDVTIEFLPAK